MPEIEPGSTEDTRQEHYPLHYHSSPKPMIFVPVLVTPPAMLCAQRIISGTEYLLHGSGHGNHMKANDSLMHHLSGP